MAWSAITLSTDAALEPYEDITKWATNFDTTNLHAEAKSLIGMQLRDRFKRDWINRVDITNVADVLDLINLQYTDHPLKKLAVYKVLELFFQRINTEGETEDNVISSKSYFYRDKYRDEDIWVSAYNWVEVDWNNSGTIEEGEQSEIRDLRAYRV